MKIEIFYQKNEIHSYELCDFLHIIPMNYVIFEFKEGVFCC